MTEIGQMDTVDTPYKNTLGTENYIPIYVVYIPKYYYIVYILN